MVWFGTLPVVRLCDGDETHGVGFCLDVSISLSVLAVLQYIVVIVSLVTRETFSANIY